MSRVVAASILAAAALAAAPQAAAGRWALAAACVLTGLGWYGGWRRAWAWPSAAGMLVLVAAAGYAALDGAAPGWGLAAVVAALAAWDLTGFGLRLRAAGRVLDEAALWRAHLRLLGAVAAAGLALGATALLLRVQLGFGWTLLLGLVAGVALARAVSALRP